MLEEFSLEECRALAKKAGLRVADDELERLLPGINRARTQAAELREIVDAAAEPVPVFAPAGLTGK